MGNRTIVDITAIDVTKKDYIFWSINMAKTLGYICVLVDSFGNVLDYSPNIKEFLNCEKLPEIGSSICQNSICGLFTIYEQKKDLLMTQHDEIISKKSKHIFLEVFQDINDVRRSIISYKTPIFDVNGNFIAIHIQYKNFSVARLANLGAKFFQTGGYPLNRDEFQKYELTRTQKMVLYLYARNYSYTDVSIWLSRFGYKVSPAAVNKHLHNLKNIFGVESNEALRDMSFKLGYDVAIPAEFIPLGSWDISNDVFDLWLC
ncbi:MAG: hypothetical protein PHC75_03485 [Burkholderiales bacterium]|nr:hypothetical protein [Burkholderiales bacterium]